MPEVFHLKNGLICVCDPRPRSGAVSMQVYIKYGSLNEGLEENGLTFLTQESCAGGSLTKSRTQLAEDLESKGSTFSSSTERGFTYFKSEALTRHADDTFAVMSDMIRNPAFVSAEIQKTKGQVEQWISSNEESPGFRTDMEFFKAAFSGQALGNPTLGTKEMLASFSRDEVVQKHAELLAHPEKIVISFAGDITVPHARELVETYFADLPSATTDLAQRQNTFVGGDFREANNNGQLNLKIGFPAPSRSNPDRYTQLMITEYLSGMSAPLFQKVREERSLVYGIHPQYSAFDDVGFFAILAGTGKGKAAELLSVTLDVFGGIIEKGVDPETLDQIRERAVRNKEYSIEKASKACEANARDLFSFGHILSLEEFSDRLKQVTSDDIRRVCAQMLQGGTYALAAIGPQETLPSRQEIQNLMQKQLEGIALPSVRRGEELAIQYNANRQNDERTNAPTKMSVLNNGMKVVTLERSGPLSCGAWVGAGSSHETPALNGATHMNEHMMFKGTPSYGPSTIKKIVECELGGGLNAYTDRDRTAYYFWNLKPDSLEKVVDICGEMVFKANLAHDEFNGKEGAKGERDVVIEEIKKSNDNLRSRRWDLANETAYPAQPHGRPILGTESTLRAMTVEQLARYRDEFYAPNNVVFSAAGPIKHEDFAALIEQKLGHLPAKQIQPLPMPDYKGGTAFTEMESARLCNLVVAAPSVSHISSDKEAYMALAVVLCGGASSRLYKEIVIHQGLAANIFLANANYRNAGSFAITASAKPENIRPLTETVYAEIRRVADDLCPAELDKAKALNEIHLRSGFEANEDACNFNGTTTLAFDKPVTLAEQLANIHKVSLDDVKRVAREVLSANPTFAAIVPKGTDPRFLLNHQEVLAMRDGTLAATERHPAPS